jgi:hypothetical protein
MRPAAAGALAGCAALLAAGALAGCAAQERPAPLVPPTLAEWRGALAALGAMRDAAAGGGPHTLRLAMALREPFTGRRTEARGAVALSAAERAVRMILVGPGGTTAFDLWIKDDKFRMSIPAIDLLRRGDASTPRAQMRGLPVDFLRWWLLDPTRGELLWTDGDAARTRYVLREGPAITVLEVATDRKISARRQTWSAGDEDASGGAPRRGKGAAGRSLLDEEKVTADQVGCGHARYTQASTGVEIEIACEGVEPNPPSARAFVDPDAPEEDE